MARPKKDAAVAPVEAGAQAPVETGEAVEVTESGVELPEETKAAEATMPNAESNDETADVAVEVAEFPKELTVQNNTQSQLVFPLIKSTVPMHSEIQAVFESKDQLVRFKSDASQICEVNGWTDGIVVVE